MKQTNKSVLYIDSENLKFYLKKVLVKNKIRSPELENYNYGKLLSGATKKYGRVEKRFYAAKLKEYKGSLTKSKELIEKQRVMKSNLEKQGFKFVMSGNVRGQTLYTNGKKKVVFAEKGVDVQIAVDMVSDALKHKVKTVIICSSDSDLQPAVKIVKNSKIKVVYLGFEINPNKGLVFTANKSILLPNKRILDVYKKQQLKGEKNETQK